MICRSSSTLTILKWSEGRGKQNQILNIESNIAFYEKSGQTDSDRFWVIPFPF